MFRKLYIKMALLTACPFQVLACPGTFLPGGPDLNPIINNPDPLLPDPADPNPDVIDCPPGWIKNPTNRNCYRLTSRAGTWNDAEAEAVANGGHLVTIRNASLNQWLISVFDTGSYRPELWITYNGSGYSNFCNNCTNNPGPHTYLHGANHGDPGTWNDNRAHDTDPDLYLLGIMELVTSF